jgi:hypothetical protein
MNMIFHVLIHIREYEYESNMAANLMYIFANMNIRASLHRTNKLPYLHREDNHPIHRHSATTGVFDAREILPRYSLLFQPAGKQFSRTILGLAPVSTTACNRKGLGGTIQSIHIACNFEPERE